MLAHVIQILFTLLALVLFPVMFMGFYRFAAFEFPVIIRWFGIAFLGGVLTFILAGILEQLLLKRFRFSAPLFLETAFRRGITSLVLLMPVYVVSWVVSGRLFPDATFGFDTIVRWAALMAVLMGSMIIQMLLGKWVDSHRGRLATEVLQPFLTSLGYKVSPGKIMTPDWVVSTRFPFAEPESTTSECIFGMFVSKAYPIAVGNITITESRRKNGKQERLTHFEGTAVYVPTKFTLKPSIVLKGTGYAPDFELPEAFGKAITLDLMSGLDTLEELMQAPVSMCIGEDGLWLDAGHFHFPAGGAFPPKAWSDGWIKKAVTLIEMSESLAEIVAKDFGTSASLHQSEL